MKYLQKFSTRFARKILSIYPCNTQFCARQKPTNIVAPWVDLLPLGWICYPLGVFVTPWVFLLQTRVLIYPAGNNHPKTPPHFGGESLKIWKFWLPLDSPPIFLDSPPFWGGESMGGVARPKTLQTTPKMRGSFCDSPPFWGGPGTPTIIQ